MPSTRCKASIDDALLQRFFYFLKKDFFPYVYWNRMVSHFSVPTSFLLTLYQLSGGWFGPIGHTRPRYDPPSN